MSELRKAKAPILWLEQDGSEDVMPCSCSFRQIENYRQRISGPLLDRNVRVFM